MHTWNREHDANINILISIIQCREMLVGSNSTDFGLLTYINYYTYCAIWSRLKLVGWMTLQWIQKCWYYALSGDKYCVISWKGRIDSPLSAISFYDVDVGLADERIWYDWHVLQLIDVLQLMRRDKYEAIKGLGEILAADVTTGPELTYSRKRMICRVNSGDSARMEGQIIIKIFGIF